MAKLTKLDDDKKFAIFLVVAAAIGLIAAFILTIEKISLLKNPVTQLSCNINPIVACGSVIQSKQAEAFGFANPLIGLVSFGVIITIGMGMLAGAKYKRWFWLGLEAGTIFGVLFSLWLFYQSVYVIQALCPYCMVVWATVIALFVNVTIFNINQKFIKLPAKYNGLVKFLNSYKWWIIIGLYLVIIALIGNHFWYYWKTLI
jgi:uncharacterized membrane protein